MCAVPPPATRPATPALLLPEHRHLLLVAIGAMFAFLGRLGRHRQRAGCRCSWDSPIQRFVEANRSDGLDTFFLTMSRFGSTIVVLSVGVLADAPHLEASAGP